MELELEAFRRVVTTRRGPVSYLDTGGEGPVALFVHGIATNAHLWRNVVEELRPSHRCIALDLPLHGGTPASQDETFTLASLADVVGAFCEELDLWDVNLVANDTGGAVSQVFAVSHVARLRTLTLTNCETHTNMPGRAFAPTVVLARVGLLAPLLRSAARDPARARRRIYRSGYQRPEALPTAVCRSFLSPLAGSRRSARRFQHWVAGMNSHELVALQGRLRELEVPTLVVWGTADRFFPLEWAYWLRDTIPGAHEVVEVPAARLFFPDERAGALTAALVVFWKSQHVGDR